MYLLSVKVLNLDEKSMYLPGSYLIRHKTLYYPLTSRVLGLKILVPGLIVQFVTLTTIIVRSTAVYEN